MGSAARLGEATNHKLRRGPSAHTIERPTIVGTTGPCLANSLQRRLRSPILAESASSAKVSRRPNME